MSVLVKKFNPHEMSEADILTLATGREKLLEIMLNEMKSCLKNGSNQHFILYGPRGIGKSFFTRLLKIHHDRSAIFKESLYIQLPEEQENINYAADLLDVIATLLEGGKLVDSMPRWSISDLQWQNAVKRLKAAMVEIQKKGFKHVFVTQENMQVFIPKLDKLESSRLREFLSSFDGISLIGSSLRPDLDDDYSKRLFQVFKKVDIEPWTSDDFLKYYEKLASQSINEQAQLTIIKKSRNKIKAISVFTGGSPRLAVLLSKLILDKNILDTVQLLDGIIDELTSYYQDITNDIPAKSGILFDMLIRKGENMTQSSLAAAFDPPLDQSTIARSFSWLLDNYYVIFTKQNKGNTKYFYVRDRLYVLYYQKRMIYADMPYSFVGVFVDFLTEFYSQREKRNELQQLQLDHPYAQPLLYHLAKKENLAIEENADAVKLRDDLLNKYDDSIKNKKEIGNKANGLITQAEEFLELGNKNHDEGQFDKAIIAYQKAIDLNPDYAPTYFNLGNSYDEKGEYDQAILVYKKAIDLKPDYLPAYFNLGNSYDEKGEYDQAILAYQKVIDLNPDYAPTYFNLGSTYDEKGEYDQAILAYKKAIDLKSDFVPAYYNLGNSYLEKGEYDQANLAYQKAIDLKPDYANAYNNLAYSNFVKGEYDQAIESLQKAIQFDSKNPSAYSLLGSVFAKTDALDKANETLLNGLKEVPNALIVLDTALALIIENNLWNYLESYSDLWKGDRTISKVLGSVLHNRTREKPMDRFGYFKNTTESIKQLESIDFFEVITVFCLRIYNDGNFDFLRQIVEELQQEYKVDPFMTLIIQAFNYLLNPTAFDINQLHPDVRSVVESIVKNN